MNTGSEHGDSVPDECFANPRLAEVYDDLAKKVRSVREVIAK